MYIIALHILSQYYNNNNNIYIGLYNGYFGVSNEGCTELQLLKRAAGGYVYMYVGGLCIGSGYIGYIA